MDNAQAKQMTMAELLKLKQLDAWQRLCCQTANPNDVVKVIVTKTSVTFLE